MANSHKKAESGANFTYIMILWTSGSGIIIKKYMQMLEGYKSNEINGVKNKVLSTSNVGRLSGDGSQQRNIQS
jgi:hypothetical protein